MFLRNVFLHVSANPSSLILLSCGLPFSLYIFSSLHSACPECQKCIHVSMTCDLWHVLGVGVTGSASVSWLCDFVIAGLFKVCLYFWEHSPISPAGSLCMCCCSCTRHRTVTFFSCCFTFAGLKGVCFFLNPFFKYIPDIKKNSELTQKLNRMVVHANWIAFL